MGRGRVLEVPVSLLEEHPLNSSIYRYDEEQDRRLAASIKEYGLLEEVRVVPGSDGRYVILSGHRRVRAARLLGMETVPCVVVDPDGADPVELLVEFNRTAREKTVMEKAREIRMLKEVFGRRRGRPVRGQKNCNGCSNKAAAGVSGGTGAPAGKNCNGCSNNGAKLWELLGISERKFFMYDRLNDLIPEYQQMVDSGALGLALAERLAGLPADVQKGLWERLGMVVCELAPEEVRKVKEQNYHGYVALEALQRKISDLEKEVMERKQREGEIEELEKRIADLRKKKREAEYDLISCRAAAEKAKDGLVKRGTALLLLLEELLRQTAAAKPRLEMLLLEPLEPNTAAYAVKWVQSMKEVVGMVEAAAGAVRTGNLSGGRSGSPVREAGR